MGEALLCYRACGEHMRHISGLGDQNGRPFHHSLCTLTKALARLRSGLLFRPLIIPRREHTWNDTATTPGQPLWMVFAASNRSERVSAASDRAASCSYRVGPRVLRQHIRRWALWSDASVQYR